MVRSSKSDRLFIRTLEGDLAYAAQRINDVAPSLVDSIVTLQQFGTGRSAQSTVVFAIAPDGAYVDKVWQTTYTWATQLIDRL